MKKLIILSLISILSLNLSAQDKGVNFEHGTLQEALNKAKKNKKGPKQVFLDCYTSWCGPCKNMANNVFPTEEAGKYFNANFVNIKIDMEKGEGPAIAKQYKVAAYPTFLILDENGKEIGRIVGGGSTTDFINKVDKAKDVTNSVDYIKAQYQKDSSIDNAVKYLACLSNAYKVDEKVKFFDEMIEYYSPMDIFSTDAWKYMQKNMTQDPKLFNYLVDNKLVAEENIGKNKVERLFKSKYINDIMGWLQGRSKLTDDQIRNELSALRLICDYRDTFENICAKVAQYRLAGKPNEIAKLYNYASLAYLCEADQMPLERMFAGLREISKEQVESYYKEKAAALQRTLQNDEKNKERILKMKK